MATPKHCQQKSQQNRSITCPSSIDPPSLGRNFQNPFVIYMLSWISKSNSDNMHRQQAFSWHYRGELSSLSKKEKKSFVYTKKTSHDIIVAHFIRVETLQNLDWRCMSDREISEFMKRKEIWRRYFVYLAFFCAVFLLCCTGRHSIVVVDILRFTSPLFQLWPRKSS